MFSIIWLLKLLKLSSSKNKYHIYYTSYAILSLAKVHSLVSAALDLDVDT